MKNNKQNFIRTVLGDIAPEQLGFTNSHEHLIRSGGIEVREHKDFLMDSVPAGIAEFQEWIDHGGKSLVCCDPIGCGRNVPKMLEIAEQFRNKGHILMLTGFHKAHFYDTKISFLAVTPVDDVVDMCVKEIEEGMDLYSYAGPVVKRTKAKAGLIKAGTGYGGIHPFEMKSLEVAAKTHLRTGCPILVHCQLGTMAYEAAEILIGHGADPSSIALCHLNKNPDKYYYKKVLELGVNICFDGPDRVKYFPDSLLAENIHWVLQKNPKFADQILLSMDAGRCYYQTHYSIERGGVYSLGVKYLITRFIPLLKEVGVTQEQIDKFMIHNPREWLTFREVKKAAK